MQKFVVFQIALLAAAVALAAKLPLPTQDKNVAANFEQVPSQPSTLYEAPFEDLPAPTQQVLAVQTQAKLPKVPAELSTLYEAPVEDVPSLGQPSLSNVNVVVSLPLPEANIPAPAQQPLLIQTLVASENLPTNVQQSAVNIVPVPNEPSTLYEVPLESSPVFPQQLSLAPTGLATQVEDFPVPVQQPSLTHSPINLVSVPAVTATSYEVPLENVPAPSQQPSLVQSPFNVVPEPAEPVFLHNIPSGSIPTPTQQTALNIVPVPEEPSILYETPLENLPALVQQPIIDQVSAEHVPFPSQQTSIVQTPVDVVLVPDDLSTLYEVPIEDTATAQQATLVQTQAQIVPVPSEPSSLYKVPVELVLVPVVPSVLYEAPAETASFSFAKAMTSGSETQNQFENAPSPLYEVPEVAAAAAANSPVAIVVKGGAMMGMPYDFKWGVEDSESGNAFTHYENSNGQSTQGQYRVNLPDGRIQVVNFYDNGDGFHADVSYE